MNQLTLPSKAEFMEKLSRTRCSRRERRRIGLVYNFSLRLHLRRPPRASGEHYFWHIYRAVMKQLDDFIYFDLWNAKAVETLLLHDATEDAKESNFDPALVYRKVIKSFGNGLAYRTLAMTKREGENSEDALIRLIEDATFWESLLDKVYDRGDNLETLDGMKEDKQRRKLKETERHFPKLFAQLEAMIKLRVREKRLPKEWLLLLFHLRQRHNKLVAQNKLRLRRTKV